MARRLAPILALLVAGCSRAPLASSLSVADVLDWASKQGLKAGTVASMRPPHALARIPGDGRVDVVHTNDGRYCVLVKTEFFGHDNSNFRGVLSCSGAVRARELQAAHGTYPASVSLSGCTPPGCGVFEELYIDHRRDDRTFDVSFDLN